MQKWRCNSSTHNCRLSRIYKTMNHNNQNQTNNTWLWKTLKKVHMHSLQSNIPLFLGLNRCAVSRKWICFKFKFNLKWEADILSQSDDGVGTQKWASPEPISQLLNTPTCNIHTRTILIDILTSKRSVGTPLSDEKCMLGTKNYHFLMLCHKGQLGSPWVTRNVCLGRKMITFSCCVMKVSSERPVSDKKCMFGTKDDHFLKLCYEGQLGSPWVTKNVCLERKMITFSTCVMKVSWAPPPPS